MANLIITVIAIALVAVASLMGAYYGGSAFLNNQSAAGASTVLNEGQQLAGAWQAFLSDNYNNYPDQVTCLTGGACTANQEPNGGGPIYLANIPNYPAAAGNLPAGTIAIVQEGISGVIHHYAVADVGHLGAQSGYLAADPNSAACFKIIKTAKGAVPGNLGPSDPYSTVTATGNGVFGCQGLNTGTTTAITGSSLAAFTNGDYAMSYKLD